MKKVSSLLLLVVVIFTACKEASFKKGLDDLEYKIISDGKGPKLQYGNYMQIEFATYYNTGKKDSLLNDSRTSGNPVIEILDSVATPPAYFNILTQLKKGDSVVIRILSDSAFKKAPDQMPPFIKKGHMLLTTVKLVNIFKSKSEADSARNAYIAEQGKKDSINAIAQLVKDDKILSDYIAKNNIKAVKTANGTYVEIIQPGTGNMIDTSVVVKTNYTGRTIDGKMFDSNTDPSKGHVMPFNVNMTNNPALGQPVIKGWTDGLKLLNKGAKAKFYIPSTLGYGAQGAGEDIAPNSVLLFDIEVLDVLNKEQALADIQVQNKKMQEMQKRYMDSVSNLQKSAAPEAKK
ncbi:MAG: FKBP-type peptidyl-prolyl cis-trans isomerase [Ferruginibacter sp.]|nr:FKBP-type peptidyl-prolyl cis-trans isomerase [Ferruginibacter sp.]